MPLALSWLFMAAESPISLSVISRSPDATVNTAAFLVLMSLAIFIESPVIDLLSTSTTLAKSRHAYEQLVRFTWIVMALVTVVHGAVAWTPLWDIVTLQLLHMKPEVAEAAHWPMRIMTVWSALVGWRRFRQGIMIRYGVTKPISIGTLLRVAAIAGVGFGLHAATKLDGLVITAVALLVSVATECLFVHFASMPVIRREFYLKAQDEEPVTLDSLFRFHWPLTASTMVMLMGMPLLSWAIGQSEGSVVQLASWQLAFSLLWMFRTVTFALPETVIALGKDSASRATLQKFCLQVGLICSGALAAGHLTGFDGWWFGTVLQADPGLIGWARWALFLAVSLPLLSAIMSCQRGFLTSARVTSARLYAIAAGMSTLVGCLLLGVALKWPGVVNGVVATTVSLIAESAVLAWNWRRVKSRLDEAESVA